MTGDVADVTFDNVKYGQSARGRRCRSAAGGLRRRGSRLTLRRRMGRWRPSPWTRRSLRRARRSPSPRNPRPERATPGSLATERKATGRRVRHRFPDAEGTELDGAENGAGRFRVLLHVEGQATGNQDWAAQGVVAVAHWHEAATSLGATQPGLAWQIYPGAWTELPDLAAEQRGLHRRIAQSARRCAGLYALRRRMGRLHRHSRRRRLYLSPAGSRRRAAGDRRRGSGQDRPALCAGLRLAGQRDALRSRLAGPARGQAHVSSGGPALGQPGLAAAALGRPRAAADRRASGGVSAIYGRMW